MSPLALGILSTSLLAMAKPGLHLASVTVCILSVLISTTACFNFQFYSQLYSIRKCRISKIKYDYSVGLATSLQKV